MSVLASYKQNDRQTNDIELVIPLWSKVCSNRIFAISLSRATFQQRNEYNERCVREISTPVLYSERLGVKS